MIYSLYEIGIWHRDVASTLLSTVAVVA